MCPFEIPSYLSKAKPQKDTRSRFKPQLELTDKSDKLLFLLMKRNQRCLKLISEMIYPLWPRRTLPRADPHHKPPSPTTALQQNGEELKSVRMCPTELSCWPVCELHPGGAIRSCTTSPEVPKSSPKAQPARLLSSLVLHRPQQHKL